MTATDRAWMERGNCKGLDPALMYPDRGEPTADAKAICRSCQVRERCLEWALAENEIHGVWGGTSARERRIIRKARRSTPKAGEAA